MPIRPCHMCEERPGELLLTIAETGESNYVCLPCSPFWLAAVFEAAGMPGLTFGFEEPEPGVIEQIEADNKADAAEARNGRRRKRAEPAPEPQAVAASDD